MAPCWLQNNVIGQFKTLIVEVKNQRQSHYVQYFYLLALPPLRPGFGFRACVGVAKLPAALCVLRDDPPDTGLAWSAIEAALGLAHATSQIEWVTAEKCTHIINYEIF